MRSNIKIDEGKSKDHQVALNSVVGDIRRVVEANQLRLQHLELAVANLTTICNGLRNELGSLGLGLSNQGPFRKVQPETIDIKSPFSRSNSPDGVHIHKLADHAVVALGTHKESKTSPIKVSGDVKANPKSPTRPAPKNVEATTNHKMPTIRSLIQTTESTTVEKKTSMKLATNNNNMGTTQLKTVVNNMKPPTTMSTTTTAEVSLKSTVKKTNTMMSKVRVESSVNAPVRSSIRNVEKIKGNGGIRVTIKANQDDNSQIAMKPRRKWSTTREVTLKN